MPYDKKWLADKFIQFANIISPPPIVWHDRAPVMRMIEDPEEVSYRNSGVEVSFQKNNTRYIINLLSERDCSDFNSRITEQISAYTIDSSPPRTIGSMENINIWTKEDTQTALSIFRPWSKGKFPEDNEIVSYDLIGISGASNALLDRGSYKTDEEHQQALKELQLRRNKTLQAASKIICSRLNPATTTHSAVCRPAEVPTDPPQVWKDLV